MPELPEVETISRQLNRAIKNQTVKAIEVLRQKSWQGRQSLVKGKKILGVGRKAKMLIVDLSDGVNLLIHLKMTGQLIYNGQPSKHTRVVLNLTKGRLFFNDLRVFGWIRVLSDKQLEAELANLPPDVVDKDFNPVYLKKILAGSRRAVKLIIVDQAKLGGVGNIYANDGLYCSKIHPQTPGNQLAQDPDKVRELWRCLKRVVGMGIRYGGATAKDENYVNLKGLGGRYQEHFLVYEQQGKKCRRCGRVIRKVKLGGRGTYFCPRCQK